MFVSAKHMHAWCAHSAAAIITEKKKSLHVCLSVRLLHETLLSLFLSLSAASPSYFKHRPPPPEMPRCATQVHNEECCVDTLPRQQPGEAGGPALGFEVEGEGGGGRGLCFRDAFQRYADPPEWEALRSPDVVYFGSGLHFLHMCGPGKRLEAKRVQG